MTPTEIVQISTRGSAEEREKRMQRLEVTRDGRVMIARARKVDIRLPGKGDSNSHGARPVHQKHRWTRTSRFSIKNSLILQLLFGSALRDDAGC